MVKEATSGPGLHGYACLSLLPDPSHSLCKFKARLRAMKMDLRTLNSVKHPFPHCTTSIKSLLSVFPFAHLFH